MKKLVVILFLFVASLFIAEAQSRVTYIDSLKSVTVSVTSDKKQATSMEISQMQFARVVENQTTVNAALGESLKEFTSELTAYTKEIEKRNKSDGIIVTDKFNYSPEKVLNVMKVNKWINFFMYFLSLLYLFYVGRQLNRRNMGAEEMLVRGFYFTLYGLASFIVLKFLLTVIFNGDYYVIKELIKLY